MAKEGSVAPKERINITFKPATGNAQEEIELPLKLLVLGISPSVRTTARSRTANRSASTRTASTKCSPSRS